MTRFIRAIRKRTFALILACALGVMANVLWVYYEPDAELDSDTYDLVRAKESVLVWWYQPSAFRVFVPPKYEVPENLTCNIPNVLTLVVSMDASKHLNLNGDDLGTLEDTSKLKDEFRELFRQRLENHAYGIGMESRTDLSESERIEKTVYIRAYRSLTYAEVLKLIDEVKDTGANPIGLLIDDDLFNPFYIPPIYSSTQQLIRPERK